MAKILPLYTYVDIYDEGSGYEPHYGQVTTNMFDGDYRPINGTMIGDLASEGYIPLINICVNDQSSVNPVTKIYQTLISFPFGITISDTERSACGTAPDIGYFEIGVDDGVFTPFSIK